MGKRSTHSGPRAPSLLGRYGEDSFPGIPRSHDRCNGGMDDSVCMECCQGVGKGKSGHAVCSMVYQTEDYSKITCLVDDEGKSAKCIPV